MLSWFRVFRGPALAILCSACGAPSLIKLPSAPGTPATDISTVQEDALRGCQAVSSLTAEIGVSGSVGGHRARGRLIGGFDASSTRLEAAAPFGAPAFIFVARSGDATLLLPRDGRVLEHGKPAEVLAAVTGVPLGASELFHTIIGCELPDRLANPMAIGDNWRAAAEGGAKAYFHRESAAAPWRLVSVFMGGDARRWSWRADYADFANGLPRTVHLVGAERNRFDLRLALSQVETNVPLAPDAFRVVIPPGYERITIDDLRRAGPLASDAD